MTISKWWMRIVGLFYLLVFVMAAFVKAPIREEGPAGALYLAARGDPMARFVVDTWVTLGLELGAVGVALLVASRAADRGRALIWTVGAMELAGIAADIYKIVRGYDLRAPLTWMVVHSVIVATGLWALRESRRPAAFQP